MPLVQVRDFPETLYDRLQHAAREEHRSVPQQVVALVERSLDGAPASLGSPDSELAARGRLFEAIVHDAPKCRDVKGLPSDAELVRRERGAR